MGGLGLFFEPGGRPLGLRDELPLPGSMVSRAVLRSSDSWLLSLLFLFFLVLVLVLSRGGDGGGGGLSAISAIGCVCVDKILFSSRTQPVQTGNIFLCVSQVVLSKQLVEDLAKTSFLAVLSASLFFIHRALAFKGGGPYASEVTRGQDLTGRDFSGKTLIKQGFRTSILRQTSFKGAKLLGASFFDADLTGSDLSDADLRCADFSLANVTKISQMCPCEMTNENTFAKLRMCEFHNWKCYTGYIALQLVLLLSLYSTLGKRHLPRTAYITAANFPYELQFVKVAVL
ncbi:hypothetical protein GH714_011101 [Hevea brasiliensis]|uniref:Pentapeptide repeat-containing protein n=1 Tax=Hevea brasiliensis TaxID=3981 RepID=A0A6A6N2Y4_HEVBR|nr:hypothetical protein GH714_011101 [Hevea brasiliensis]